MNEEDIDKDIIKVAADYFILGTIYHTTKLGAKGDRRVYKVASEFGVVIVKASAVGETEEKITKDIYSLQYLEQFQFPAPKLLKNDSGSVITHANNRIIYGYSFIEGIPPKQSNEYFYNLGKLLSQLHTLPINTYPYESTFTPEIELPKLKEEFKIKSMDITIPRINELKEIINNFPSFSSLPKGIIHTDPYLTNLVQGKDALYLIDLDDAGIAPVLIDIGYVIAHGCTTEPRNREENGVDSDEVLWHQKWAESFFEGYQHIRKLEEGEKELLLASTRFAMLVYILYWNENGTISDSWYKRYDLLEKNVPLLAQNI